MNDKQAMAKLVPVKNAANDAINGMNRFAEALAAGIITSNVVKAREMDTVKASALKAGVDISPWTGKPAPTPE